MSLQERLSALDLELPPPPAPVASYVSRLRAHDLVFVAGQIPTVQGELLFPGTVGEDVSLEQAQEGAKRCALQLLSVLNAELENELDDRLVGMINLTVYVAAADGFTDHPLVANGASDLLVELLGDKGKHTRVAVGVRNLPLGASVEISMIAQVV